MKNMTRHTAVFALLIALAVALVLSGTPHNPIIAGPEVMLRLSLNNVSGGGNGASWDPSITPDGRYTVFASNATNLLSGDTNGVTDIYRKDLQTAATTRVSTTAASGLANGASTTPSISDDGRFVAFASAAGNLVAGDANGLVDIFRKDLLTGAVELVSTDSTETANGNGPSEIPTISADGRYVAFRSAASNLVGSDTNGVTDVFLRDAVGGTTTRVSTSSAGVQGNGSSGTTYGPYLAAGGRYVAFESEADNLLGAGADTNTAKDIFVKDAQTGALTRASTTSAGGQANERSFVPSISGDGRYVLFRSIASNLGPGDTLICGPFNCSDVFRKDTVTGETYWVSTSAGGAPANRDCWDPHISRDGRFAAFSTDAGNLVAGDTNENYDIFVKDTANGAITLVSQNSSGQEGNGYSTGPFINDGGEITVFESLASNFTGNDTNAALDAFLATTAATTRDYWFSWYDDVGGSNWVLMANPAGAATNLWFEVDVAGVRRPLPRWCDPMCSPLEQTAYVGGQVPQARLEFARLGGFGGPVRASSLTSAPGIVSQRTLWPAGGDSLEELPAIPAARLSDRYVWSWYDQASSGFTNWVLVSNPGPAGVFYRITIAGLVRQSGSLAPGAVVTPTFPGLMGGPVEVQAWADSVGGAVPADVIASQRVLSNGGNAFNEVPGIPYSELSDIYFWTWYDNASAGATNWVLLANPGMADLFYEIEIGAGGCGASPPAGTACLTDGGDALAPGQVITPTFGGIINGPVRAQGFANAAHSAAADLIATQRSIWGPSFEEVPGSPLERLASTYHWTWYDHFSAGVANWVMVANPDPVNSIFFVVRMGGLDPGPGSSGTIPAGGTATAVFPGLANGPVQVQTFTNSSMATPADSVASQRVLWKAHFNEVSGSILE